MNLSGSLICNDTVMKGVPIFVPQRHAHGYGHDTRGTGSRGKRAFAHKVIIPAVRERWTRTLTSILQIGYGWESVR